MILCTLYADMVVFDTQHTGMFFHSDDGRVEEGMIRLDAVHPYSDTRPTGPSWWIALAEDRVIALEAGSRREAERLARDYLGLESDPDLLPATLVGAANGRR